MAFSIKNAMNAVPLRITAQILIFIALVSMGLLLLWPVQRGISGGMTSIRDGLLTTLETLIDRKIRYSSISPSIFGTFDIRNMQIVGEDSLPVVSVSRLRVSYSLWNLIRGRAGTIRSIRIDSPRIDLDTERDRDLIDFLRSLNFEQLDSRRSLAALMPERFAVRVSGGQCLIRTGKSHYRIQDINLEALVSDNHIRLNGGLNTTVSLNRLQAEPFSAVIGIQVNGNGTTDMEEGSAVITIPAVTGNLLQMNSLVFGLDVHGGVFSLYKQADPLPFDFSVNYNPHSGETAARFNCVDFSLKDLMSFSGDWNAGNRWLDIAGTGMVLFDRGQDEKLSYRIDISGDVPAGDASFEIHGGGDERLAEIESFRFTMPPSVEGAGFLQGEIDFRGEIGLEPFAPAGILSLDNVGLAKTEGVSAEFNIKTQGSEINILSNTVRLSQAAELKALSASLILNDRELDFAISTRNAIRSGSFSLNGSMKDYRQLKAGLEASLLLDSFSPADISAMLQPFFRETLLPPLLENIIQDTVISTELFVATDSEHILYRAPYLELVYAGRQSMAGWLSISGTDKHFELSGGRFTTMSADEEVLVSAQAEYADPQNITFSINAAYRTFSYHFEGRALEYHDITIDGSYGLQVRVAENNAGAYSGTLQVRAIPIPWRDSPAYLSFLASVHYTARNSWSLAVDRLELTDIASPAGSALLRVSGRADQDGGQFPLLYYSDDIGALQGRADIFRAADSADFSGMVSMAGARERYEIQGGSLGEQLNFSISGSQMRLDRIINQLDATFADGDIRLSWDRPRSFRAEFDLASLSTKILNRDLNISAQGLADSEGLKLQGLRIDFAGLEGIMPAFTVNHRGGLAEARAVIQGLIGNQRIEGSLTLNARFRPLESWFEIDEGLNSLSGIVQVENMRYGDAGSPESFSVNFSRDNGAFLVTGGPQNMIHLQMDQDGNFFAGLTNPFPVRGSLIGSIHEKIIDARCNDLYVDLAEFWKLVPPSVEIVLAGGYVNASVDIRGPLSDPEFFGWARASSLRVQIPRFITRDIRPIPFTVAIAGNEMNFGPVPATAGNGTGTISGQFQFDRWIPNIFNMDIQIPHETPIPFSFDITNFTARGDASGNLNLSMENVELSVKGELVANNTEMSMDTDENVPVRSWDRDISEVKVPVIMDISMSTGSSADFYWPNSSWPILRATPNIGTRIRVSADSRTRQYSINSDIRIRSGEIFYFERSFYIRSGTITFRENESHFDPRLSARAEVRERSDQGPVTISMIVENAPLLSFTPRFESNPFLSQMEIFALLGQNIYGVQGDENFGNWQQVFMIGTDFLSQFVLIRQLERQIRSFMRLDMFSIRTQFLQNVLLYNAAGAWQGPVDRPAGVGNYLDNTSVFFGKYVGQDMFIQSMLSMRYDADQMDSVTGGLSIEPDFGVELQSPLFSIRWDFSPTHPENWYLNDSSITLIKSWTF